MLQRPQRLCGALVAAASSSALAIHFYTYPLLRHKSAPIAFGASTDVIADAARTRRRRVHWLEAGSDDLLASVRLLNGFDIDHAADQTRLANRLRDALASIFLALERAAGVLTGPSGDSVAC